MVYLVWEFTLSQHGNGTLIGVWQTEENARAQCERRARELAAGSGFICEGMMGDSWEVRNRQREEWVLRMAGVTFGPLGVE